MALYYYCFHQCFFLFCYPKIYFFLQTLCFLPFVLYYHLFEIHCCYFQKELIDTEEKKDVKQILDFAITKLREQEKNDERTIKKYEQPIEESEESDDEDKSNLTYDEEDFQEAYNNVMELEERKMASQKA